jgi:hypothetical protein
MNKFFLKRILGVIMYLVVLSLLIYSCVGIKHNQQNIEHIREMNQVYENDIDNPYPNQNFNSLTKTIVDMSDENQSEITLTTASGVVFKRHKNVLYGLTAAHWCRTLDGPGFEDFTVYLGYENFEDAKETIKLYADYFGAVYEIEIIDMNIENDICLYSFTSPYASQADTIRIADDYPDIGDRIHTISAPLGVKGPYIRLHFDGFFGGCSSHGVECFYTVPGTNGSSGSGILNEDGDLVGILTIAIIGFHDVTGGVRLEAIKEIIDKNL